MSEENQPKRTVRTTFEGKFGVSEKRDERNTGRSRAGERAFGEKPRRFGDKERKAFDKEPRRFGDKDRFGGDRPRRFGDKQDRGFGGRGRFGDKDRFGDKGRFARGERKPFDSDRPAPVYRQRPEQKSEIVDENLDEQALEMRAVAAEKSDDAVANPPWFKKLLALTTEKGREREGRFLGEGVHVVDELISHHRELVIDVYIMEGFGDDNLIEKINEAEVNLHVLTEDQMKRLSSTVTTQGIIAHCRSASKKPNYEQSRSVLTLVDAVQDPGNLGTLFRTSLGFGSSGMVLGRGTVNPFNPKVVRGSSGTFLRVPFEFDMDLIEQINFLRSKGYTIIATDLHAKQSLREIAPHKLRKMAFLVGNEGAGTNPYFIELADETVKIPMSSELESLNVSVAHGILSYEAALIQEELK